MGLLSSLRSLDNFPKFQEDVKVKTYSGALVSIVAILLMIILFFSELNYYTTVVKTDHLIVDTSRGEKLKINVDVTFPAIPCNLLSLDVMDVSGSHQLGVDHTIHKKRLDKVGRAVGVILKEEIGNVMKEADVLAQAKELNATAIAIATAPPAPTPVSSTLSKEAELRRKIGDPSYCGSCYGAEERPGQCCNTCNQVKETYRSKGWAFTGQHSVEQCIGEADADNVEAQLHAGEGCQIYGYLEVNKVAGNFHFAPGRSFQHAHMHVHDLAAFSNGVFNTTHTVNQLSFGEHFPGIVNPLDRVGKVVEEGGGVFQYYVKVVRTTYEYLNGKVLETNQFSVTEHETKIQAKEGHGIPGVFFFYDISPIMVLITETRRSFLHFLTQLCAIIGGVFTVAGIIDRVVFSAVKRIEKKMAGKYG